MLHTAACTQRREHSGVNTPATHLLAGVPPQQLFYVVELAAVRRQVLTDLQVELLQLELVVVVRGVPQCRLLLLDQRLHDENTMKIR